MIVKQLSVKDILRIEEVDISPDSKIIQISGANEAGKTSLFNSIEMALNAKSISKHPMPVRKGQDKGVIELTIGDSDNRLKIKRTVLPDGKNRILVTNGDGKVYPAPQTMLDSLRNHISFDPHDFATMSGKDQAEMLLHHLGIEEELAELEEERKEQYDLRTVVNRQSKDKEAQRSGLPYHMGDFTEVPVSVTELMTELKLVEKQEKSIIDSSSRIKEMEKLIEEEEKVIDRIKYELEEQINFVNGLQIKYNELQEEYGNIQPPNTTSDEIKKHIEDSEGINKKIADNQKRHSLEQEIKKLNTQSEELTNEIKSIDMQKEEIIRNAGMPLDSVTFMENMKDGLMYNGMPMSQLSTGEAIRVSTQILMGLNPELKLIWIKNGSLLDSKNLQAIQDAVNEYGEKEVQIWMEMVDESGEVGIVIEDGHVLKQNTQ